MILFLNYLSIKCCIVFFPLLYFNLGIKNKRAFIDTFHEFILMMVPGWLWKHHNREHRIKKAGIGI